MSDKWLENLKKVWEPDAKPVSVVSKAGPVVPLEFVDLVKVDGGDEDVAGITVSQTFDTDTPIADVADPVAEVFKTEANKKFRIAEPGATHEGLEFEKIGNQTIKRYFHDGKLTKTVIVDPDAFPRQQTFEADAAVIEKSLAKIIGVEELEESVAGE
jgi:hypothetical protein